MNLRLSSVTDRTRTSTKVALVSAVTIAAALLQAPAAHATPIPIVSGAWTYIITDSGATITGYDETLGGRNNLVIPESIDSHLVTAIGDNAFAEDDLTGNVTMPDTITSIGSYAFFENDFDTIHLSTSLTTIGTYGFATNYSLESIVLPPSLNNIGDYAFDGNVNLNLIASLASTPPTVAYDTFADVEAEEIQVSTGVVAAWATFDGLDVVGVECVNASGGYFAGGSGTTSDPYTIATAAQLDWVRYIFRGCAFKLTTDISLDPYIEYHARGSWGPIGSSSEPFTGNFDGSNNSITNLLIDSSTNYVGLFGKTLGATINDLRVSGTVAGAAYVGGLVGYALTTTVTHVSADVDILVRDGFAGGLIGFAEDSSIESSSAAGSVIPLSGNADYLGGLIGIFGSEMAGNHISQSFATGNVVGIRASGEGNKQVGGLIGFAGAAGSPYAFSITDVFATGNVIGDGQVGGLIGESHYANVTSAFATGDNNSHDGSGGLIGLALSTDTAVLSSFWDTDTTGYDNSSPYGDTDEWALETGAGGPRTTAQMKAIATYATTGWNITSSAWSDSAVWGICPEANGGYPYLLAFSTSASHPCSDPVPDSPAAPDVAPAPPTTVMPTVSPIIASPPVASIPVSTVVTAPQYPKISASTPATFKTALAQLSRSVPASSTVEYSIPRMFQKNCAIRRGKIVALKAGTCGIRITSTTPKGRQTNQRVYLTVT